MKGSRHVEERHSRFGGAHGRPGAGHLRNIAMLDQQPTRVLTFHCQPPGTAYTIREARARRLRCGQRCRHDCSPTQGTIWRGLPLARFRLANPWKHQRGTWPSITPLRNERGSVLGS